MKKRLWLVVLIFVFGFSTSCRDKAAIAELEKYKAQAKVEEQNKELARNFIAAIDRNDFGMIKELCSADFAISAPGLTEPLNVETLIQVIQAHYGAFPDWKHTIDGIVSEGNTVIMRIDQSGTHKAPYEGIPPTEKKVTEPGLYLFIVDSGKVKGGYVIEDSLGFYLQLGMELKAKGAKK